jgi:hypothetical protein
MKDMEIQEILLKFDEMEESAQMFKKRLNVLKEEKKIWKKTKENLKHNIKETEKENEKLKMINYEMKQEKRFLENKFKNQEMFKERIEMKNKQMRELMEYNTPSNNDNQLKFESNLNNRINDREEDGRSKSLTQERNTRKTEPIFNRKNQIQDQSNNSGKFSQENSFDYLFKSQPQHDNNIIEKLNLIIDLLSKKKTQNNDNLALLSLISKLNERHPKKVNKEYNTIKIVAPKSVSLSELKVKYKSLKKMLQKSNAQNLKYKKICEQYQNQIDELMLRVPSFKNKTAEFNAIPDSEYQVNQSGETFLKQNESNKLPSSDYKHYYKIKSIHINI